MPNIDGIGRKELLLPVIASAVTAGGTFAAKKLFDGGLPSVTDKLGEKVGEQAEQAKESAENSGGPLGLAAKAADKLGGNGSGGGSRGQGWGRGRRLPIQRAVDVAVPVSFAYDQWTDFEKLGDFLHRVEEVEPRGEKRIVWHENIWGRRRTWRAEIIEKRRNQLLAWKDEHGYGVLSFHSLAPRLTRIELNYDWVPHGVVEKLASGLQFHKRAAKTDLQRFKAHAETEYAKHSNGTDKRRRPTRTREKQRA
jgi:uncharacterized membrane protein